MGEPRNRHDVRGRSWRGGFVLSACESFLKRDLQKNLRILVDLQLLPAFMGQDWRYIFLQNFGGHCNIIPRLRLQDYMHIISDPSLADMKRFFQSGLTNTFPKVSQLYTHSAIAKCLEVCEQRSFARFSALYSALHPYPQSL